MKAKRGIHLALLIFWMVIIFLFSARPADVSTQDSHFIGNLVAGLVQQWEQVDWQEAQQQVFVENIDFYVRKAAHMTEYAILGALLMNCLRVFGMQWRRAGRYALAMGILYAASDEFHQYFVPGRACQVRDVVIDGIGLVLGMGIFWGINCNYSTRDKKENRIDNV